MHEIFAPAGFWPRGQNRRRHPRIPRVYTYKEFQKCNDVSKLQCAKKISICSNQARTVVSGYISESAQGAGCCRVADGQMCNRHKVFEQRFKVLRTGVCVSSSSSSISVLSGSVFKRSCNHEFAFRHHLAAFQPRVRVLPSPSSVPRFNATTKLRFAIFSSLSNHEFTSSSSISG